MCFPDPIKNHLWSTFLQNDRSLKSTFFLYFILKYLFFFHKQRNEEDQLFVSSRIYVKFTVVLKLPNFSFYFFLFCFVLHSKSEIVWVYSWKRVEFERDDKFKIKNRWCISLYAYEWDHHINCKNENSCFGFR